MDLEAIKRNYERKSDSEIIRLATTDARGLIPEAFEIIETEIKKRGLNPDILKGAKAQNKEYTNEELETYANYLRALPCPVCGSKFETLNATTTYTVKSFLIYSQYTTEHRLGCPTCLNKLNNEAMKTTALLGWWMLPYGLIRTPVYLYRNAQCKKENYSGKPSKALLIITQKNIGLIETYKGNKEKLFELMSRREE